MESLDFRFREPSSSTGTPNRPIRPATAVRSRLVGQHSICHECKRLRLKCNRKTPCDKCTENKRDCKYGSDAPKRVDVQTVHNTQIRHQRLLETLTKLLGFSEKEVQMIMDSPTYPPRPDYAGPTIDLERVQAILGTRSSRESIPQNNPTNTDLSPLTSTSRDALLPPAVITFSRPPPRVPNPSANVFSGGSFAGTSQPDQIPSTTVNLATHVFQSNSTVVSHHALAQLQLWQKVFGWEPRAANEGSISVSSINPVAAAAASVAKEDGGGSGSFTAPRNKQDNVVLVTAPPSEIEYCDGPRPKDLSVLALAHEVFIMPAIAARQHVGGGPNNVASSHVPDSLLALGLSSSDASTSSSRQSFIGPRFGVPLPHKFPALSLGSSSAPNSTSSSQPPSSPRLSAPRLESQFSSISSSPRILPLISPQVVLCYLPTQPWARAFLHEFDGLMITHDGIEASGEHSLLKKRLELMFEWADLSVKRSGSTDQDSGSKWSSPTSPYPADNQRTGSIPRGMGRGESAQEEPKPLPPPPTLGLFAVACAVYALGALSYASKSVHGTFPADGGNTPGTSAPAPDSLLNPHEHPLPDKATPSNLFNLARAVLLVHDESALPPSLDYLHAQMLTWLYLLHPSDSSSSVTSPGYQGSSTGVGSGGITAVEETIYKELGKCVSVARAMGLDSVDRPSFKPTSASRNGKGSAEGEEGMRIWEKEMRRRVWWQLMMFDQQISDNLGRLPLIPPGTYACKPPPGVDDSRFTPTSSAILRPPETTKGCNTTYFATKCQLLAIIKTLSFAQLEDGVTLKLAKELDSRISNWRGALPAQYKIDFREKREDTVFPELDTVDIQACDLHIMANTFLLRLWLPFFDEALASSSRSNQGVLRTATIAANAIIVASNHLVTHFRAARPMRFGHYDFGNSVWLATGILASVATMKPEGSFSSIARRGVEIAAALFRNQVVEGKSDSDHAPKSEVNEIMGHIIRLVGEVSKGKQPAGSKRKWEGDIGKMKMRYGVPIPYVGAAVITSETDIRRPQAQSALPPEPGLGWWIGLSNSDSDGISSGSEPQKRPRIQRKLNSGSNHESDADLNKTPSQVPFTYVGTTAVGTATETSTPQAQTHPPPKSSLRTRRNRPDQESDETSSDSVLMTPPCSEVNFHPGSYSQRPMSASPVAASALAAEVPQSRTSSRVSDSQSTISERRNFPVIGIRRRLPLAPRPTSLTSPVSVPPDSNRHAPASGGPSDREPSNSHSPHDSPYSRPSSEPVANPIVPEPNPPLTMRPFSTRQSSSLGPIFRQDRPPQHVQHLHGFSTNVTIGSSFTTQEFSQLPPSVPPDTYLSSMTQGHWASSSAQYPTYPQTQSLPNTSHQQSPLPQPYGASASAFHQTALSVDSPKAGPWCTNSPASGGPSVSPQYQHYGPTPGGSHRDTQDSPGGFDTWNMTPISVDKPFDIRIADSPHRTPVIQQQHGSPHEIYRPQHQDFDFYPEFM